MDINKYALYSLVSERKTPENCSQKILEIIEKFDSLERGYDVKQYLRDNLSIKDSIQNFPLADNGILNYSEYEDALSVEVVYNKQHSVFCFEK